MAHGKTVRLNLVDGTMDGVVMAGMYNWNGKVIKIPGARVGAYDDKDLDRVGAYFLIFPGDDGEDTLYVGSHWDVGGRIRLRIDNPVGGKGDLSARTAVAFVGDDLDEDTARCLELRLAGIATSCGRYRVVTEHKGLANLSDSLSDAVDEYIADAGLVLDALGIYALKPKRRSAGPDPA